MSPIVADPRVCVCSQPMPTRPSGIPGPKPIYASVTCRSRVGYERHEASGRRAIWRASYNARPEVREKARKAAQRYRLRESYGMTVEDYESLLALQDGRCAVCRRDKPLAVDHDHDTGEVRGLLCRDCNLAEGHMQGRPDLLHQLADYLEESR